MHRKIYKSFIQLVVIALNTHMVFGPFAYANQGNGWQNAAMYAQQITGMLGNATQAYLGGMQQQGSVEMIESQLAPVLKLQPVDPRQVPPIFNGCMVLPAAPTTMTGNMSCRKATDDQVRAGYTEAVISISEFNKKQLENFLTEGHERFTTQGKGCYNQKLKEFNGMLLAREEELAKMEKAIQQRFQDFKLATKSDLEGLKKDAALLTGQPEKYAKDIKYSDLFLGANDQGICASVYSPDTVNNFGSGGLRSIEEKMFSSMNDKKTLGYTADEILTKSKGIERDLSDLAKKIAETTDKRNDISIDPSSVTFDSKFFNENTQSLKSAINRYNQKAENEMKTLLDELKINQAVNGSEGGQNILAQIDAGEMDLDRRLGVYERDMKRNCVNTYIAQGWGSVEAFTQEFKNPNVSKKLSNRADNLFATEMSSWISNQEADIDQVWQEIEKSQKKGLNDQKIIFLKKSIPLEGQSISTSTPLKASQVYGILAKNCKDIFTKRKNPDGFTQQDMIKRLKQYGNKLDRMRRTAASKIKSELKREMLECPNDKETGVGALSCSDALNMSSNRFCLRTAKTCAANFKGCHDKVQSLKNKTRERQITVAKNYNNEMGKVKSFMNRELKKINQFMESKARSLDAQLRMGTLFKVNPLKFDLNRNFLYDGEEGRGLDEELNIEDPAKLMEMVAEEIGVMKEALQKQRMELLGTPNPTTGELGGLLGGERDKYLGNYEKQLGYWEGIIGECEQRNAAYDKAWSDSQQKTAEDNEKIKKACMELQAFNQAPDCESVGDIMKTVQQAIYLAPRPSGQGGATEQMANYYDAQTLGSLQQIKRDCGLMDSSEPISPPLPKGYNIKKYCTDYVKERRGKQADFYSDNTCSNALNALKGGYANECDEKDAADYFNANYTLCKNKRNKTKVLEGKDANCNDASEDVLNKVAQKEAIEESIEDFRNTFIELNKTGIKDANGKFTAEYNKFASEVNLKLATLGLTSVDIIENEDQIEALFDPKIGEINDQIDELKKEDENIYEKVKISKSNFEEYQYYIDNGVPKNKVGKFSAQVEEKKGCYMRYDTDNENTEPIRLAFDAARMTETVDRSQRQLGQQDITPAMCNGGYDGMFENINRNITELAEQTGSENNHGLTRE